MASTTPLSLEETIAFLASIGQSHLTQNIDKFSREEQNLFVNQINKLNSTYPGGLEEYSNRARRLLANSANNVNPYDGYSVSVPIGDTINFSSFEEVTAFESIGRQELKQTAFVLVAGGLGERLNYQGIKIGIEFEITTGQTFLEYYLSFIRAFSESAELAIMTSDDTYELTVRLLENNNYFGFPRDQLIIMKQEKVPAMINNDAHFAQLPGSLLLETKPHGHGDVHTLLYQQNLPAKWIAQGKKWMCIFQDTNPLVFRAMASALAVSKTKNLEVNSITAPRKPGEAVGAICRLQKEGSSLTINVEYNQLGALMAQEPIDEFGYSLYPGNINSLIFSLAEYNETLTKTQGLIMEFINPKYADSERRVFKSSSRLECMYQEYPKLLENDARVGCTQINRGFCFSTVKNDIVSAGQKFAQKLAPESASSCEEEFYKMNREILRLVGATVEEASKESEVEFAGIKLQLYPQVVLKPSLGVSLEEIKANIGTNRLSISANSTVVLDANDFAEKSNESISIDGQHGVAEKYSTKGSKYRQFEKAESNAPQHILIRGYDVKRN